MLLRSCYDLQQRRLYAEGVSLRLHSGKATLSSHRLLVKESGDSQLLETTSRDYFWQLQGGSCNVSKHPRKLLPTKVKDPYLYALLKENDTKFLRILPDQLLITIVANSTRQHPRGKGQMHIKRVANELIDRQT